MIMVGAVMIAGCGDDTSGTSAAARSSTTTTVATSTSAADPSASQITTTAAPSTTTRVRQDSRSLDEIERSLRSPRVGDVTHYVRAVFEIGAAGTIRDGFGPGAQLVDEHPGLLLSPELVESGGVTYVVGTESSDDRDTARTLRVARLSDVSVVAGSADHIVTSTIARFDEAGDAYVDEAPVPGYEVSASGALIRAFASEGGDVVTPTTAPHVCVDDVCS
jgi:hypothetical protein